MCSKPAVLIEARDGKGRGLTTTSSLAQQGAGRGVGGGAPQRQQGSPHVLQEFVQLQERDLRIPGEMKERLTENKEAAPQLNPPTPRGAVPGPGDAGSRRTQGQALPRGWVGGCCSFRRPCSPCKLHGVPQPAPKETYLHCTGGRFCRWISAMTMLRSSCLVFSSTTFSGQRSATQWGVGFSAGGSWASP